MSLARDIVSYRSRQPSIPAAEYFDDMRDPMRRAGRDSIRRVVLAMRPADPPDDLVLPGPFALGDGAFWGLSSRNGLTVALRAASFPTVEFARNDAAEVVGRASDWRALPVADDQPAPLHSSWFVLDGRVVLVSAQASRRPMPPAVALRRLVAVLAAG